MKDLPAYFLLTLTVFMALMNMSCEKKTKEVWNRIALYIGIIGVPAHYILTKNK